ncbi:hypothetical protein [Clostridium sp. OS1-26]|uniref:hypothetical protein n=1 Tax=Clostridium sp. OS1-26 TaxID=3070681 RepID=UPI0027DF3959|nr:hypothetical protein [Clostridium sp. OS1-26]WML34332.1 hypothetical protein RCG18_24055 [Clostridium sp. OS1-26]
MEEKFYKTEIRLKDKEFIVLTPLNDYNELFTCTQNLDYLTILGDISSLLRLAYIFAVMYDEKNIIMYLPLKRHGLTEYLKSSQGERSAKDLVILHHTIQLKINDWKTIRGLLTKKDIVSIEVEDDIFKNIDEDYRKFNYRSNKDVLDVKNKFETIFLVGSSKVYGSIANDCKELAEGEPDEFFKKYNWYHDHKHLDIYLRRWKEINFSIDYYDKKLWGE